jgi:Ca2+-binding RTX toxin-like protein
MPKTRHTILRKPAITLGVVALAGAGLAAFPAMASADSSAASSATAYIDDGAHTVHYTGGDVSSDVTIGPGPDDYTQFAIDDIVPIEVGEGCVHPDESDTTRVVCTLTEDGDFYTHVIADMGDGDDEVTVRAGDENTIHGGPGADNLNVLLSDVVYGDDGDDWIVGGYDMYGGPGDDGLQQVGSGGYAHGDDGNDTLWASPDGQSPYDDQILYGGRGNDTVYGDDAADTIYGNSGEDELRGGRGGDEISGGPDNDLIYGNSGDDELRGGSGADTMSGGPGTDDIQQG